MPEQNVNPVPITESSTRFHHQFTVAALFLVFATVSGVLLVTIHGLAPLQRYYLGRYAWACAGFQKSQRATFVEIQAQGRIALALPPDVAELKGHLVLSQAAADRQRGPLYFTPRTVPTEYFAQLLRQNIYDGQSPTDILGSAATSAAALFIVFLFGGLYLDWSSNRKRRIGIIRRGPRLLERDEFNRALKSDGIGFHVEGWPSMREALLAPRWRRGVIRLPYQAETSHALIVGATGTGKSQLLVQLMSEIQARDEAAIIYDPDGEFLSEFYNEQRGDVVLNPLDKRSPYWCPSSELAANEEALTLAASLFPDPAKADEKNTFFVRAPRQILARLFEHEPTPQELVSWLASKNEIDRRIKGTEMEEMLSKAAGPQRSGILASLSMALNAFRLLPTREDCDGRQWSAREWCATRRGWIFITSRETTRDIQRPLMSMWLDTLLLRLMTKTPNGKPPKPVWLIIDELASLNKLPSLQSALTRARKYQIKTVLGYQQQSQLQEIYGKEGAETITGNPTTKIFFRTGDANTAKAVSDSLGEQEIAREKINYTHTGGLHSRRSKTYSIEVKTERAVSASQIEGLRNLHGYIRIYDCIAAFTLRLVHRVARFDAFDPRDTLGFVPLTLPEAYQLIDPESSQAPAAPVRNALPAQPQVAGSGGGGGNSIALPADALDLENLLPNDPGPQQPAIVPLPQTRSGLATLAEVAVAHHAVREVGVVLQNAGQAQDIGHGAGQVGGGQTQLGDFAHLLERNTVADSPIASEFKAVAHAVESQLAPGLSAGRVGEAVRDVEQTLEHAHQHEHADGLGFEE